MLDAQKSGNLTSALAQLLTNYVAGRISDRRWRWIMDVLDSGRLSGSERLEYVAEINRGIPAAFRMRR